MCCVNERKYLGERGAAVPCNPLLRNTKHLKGAVDVHLLLTAAGETYIRLDQHGREGDCRGFGNVLYPSAQGRGLCRSAGGSFRDVSDG